MPQLVVLGAQLQCTMGMAPSVLTVLPANKTMGSYVPAANIMDYKPLVNIMTFGMCQSPANPVVAAATTAAMGVLTPMPCVPNTVAPWTPGSPTVLIGNMPALNSTSMCACMWAGMISITNPGQTTINIP
jgi:hypothetical protein